MGASMAPGPTLPIGAIAGTVVALLAVLVVLCICWQRLSTRKGTLMPGDKGRFASEEDDHDSASAIDADNIELVPASAAHRDASVVVGQGVAPSRPMQGRAGAGATSLDAEHEAALAKVGSFGGSSAGVESNRAPRGNARNTAAADEDDVDVIFQR
jgi:hypothetical protein